MSNHSKTAKHTVPIKIDGIRILPGDTDVVVVAPHGSYEILASGKINYRNDERTGLIAEALHKQTGWLTLINDAFIKPDTEPEVSPNLENKRLDLFKFEQADKVPGYLAAIKNAVDENRGKTLVIWLHGLSDRSAKTQENNLINAGVMKKGDGELHAIIGYGQGAHPQIGKLRAPTVEDSQSRLSAQETTVLRLREQLTGQGLFTMIARDGAGNFRGRDPKRLNQWFRNLAYAFDKVESIQIEIREKGCRENPQQCRKTASILSQALRLTQRVA
jgi:hypothetical protein